MPDRQGHLGSNLCDENLVTLIAYRGPTIGADNRVALREIIQATPDAAPVIANTAAAAGGIPLGSYRVLQIQIVGSSVAAPVPDAATATGCRVRIYIGDGVLPPALFDTIVCDFTVADFAYPRGIQPDSIEGLDATVEVVLVVDTIAPVNSLIRTYGTLA